MDAELGPPPRALIKPRPTHDIDSSGKCASSPDAARARAQVHRAYRKKHRSTAHRRSVAFIQPHDLTWQEECRSRFNLPTTETSRSNAEIPPSRPNIGLSGLPSHRSFTRDTSAPPAVNPTENLEQGDVHNVKASQDKKGTYDSHTRHKQQVQKITNLLSPILGDQSGDCSHVFICWGTRSRCSILAVKVPVGEDEVAIWRTISEAWYAERGRWRKHLPFFGVKDVIPVQVMIAGVSRDGSYVPHDHPTFMGIFIPRDVAEEKALLKTRIHNYIPQEFPCPYNPSTGMTECFSDCVSRMARSSDHPCPEWDLHRDEELLRRLKRLAIWRTAFLDARCGDGQELLDDNDMIHSHQNLLAYIAEWHCPRLGQVELNALYIDATHNFQEKMLPVSLLTLLMMVLLARLVFGDWGTAWSAGGFFVGFAALVLKWDEQRGGPN